MAERVTAAAVHEGAGRFSLTQRELIPEPGSVIVRTLMAGICGTDLGITADPPTYPSATDVLGHEAVGVVLSPGALEGATVVLDPSVACGRCAACRRHQPTQCWSFAGIGIERPGAFAREFVAPEERLLRIDPALAPRSVVLVEPLACVLHGLARATIPPPGSVSVILGGGPIGVMFALLLERGHGQRVVVSEPAASRRQHLASKLRSGSVVHVDQLRRAVDEVTAREGAGLVVDAVGGLLAVAVGVTARRGCVLAFGLADRNDPADFQPDLTRREITVASAFTAGGAFPAAIEVIEQGLLEADDVVTAVHPLEHIERAFAEARAAQGQKVLVDPTAAPV